MLPGHPKNQKLARSMPDATKGRKPDPARIAAWESAIGDHVEALFTVLPGRLGQAAVTVLAHELARDFEPPERRTQPERPDKWAAAIASHVEGLFPDREGAAAAVEFLAVRMAMDFEPPCRIGPRQPAGFGYTEKADPANPKNKTIMAQKPTRPSLDDGSRIASWRLSLVYDVHALMPNDQRIAETLVEALAIRMSLRYDPPLLREHKSVAPQPTVPGAGHC